MNNYSTDLLGIKNVLVDNFEENKKFIKFHLSTTPKYPCCPACGEKVSRIHDYRIQQIKDLPFRNKTIQLFLKKRRYRCKCGKRFFEKYPFLPRYHRMSQRAYELILNELRSLVTYKMLAIKYNVSHSTITRVFDIVDYRLYKLPEILAVDEFKGNAGGEKYQCILTNPRKHKILDILPTRKKHELIKYFSTFERKNVKIFIMDMWEPYRDIAKTYFPNAMIVVDKYHYIRQIYWALNGVRKRVQKELTKKERISFKHLKNLLGKEYKELEEEQKNTLDRMLNYNEDLKNAWELKELFNSFRDETDPNEAEKKLRTFIEVAKEINLPEYKAVITAFTNWFEYIINSKRTVYSNGFTEGINNKIKVLKRIGYGYTNFERFRDRILHLN